MKYRKGAQQLSLTWGGRQKHAPGRRLHPNAVAPHIPAVPTLPDLPNLGTLGGGGCSQEGIQMPITVSNRISLVRNNMYESYLQKSTRRLQDEIQHRMRMYSSEKQHLLQQLATLRHNMADLNISHTGLRLPDITTTTHTTQRHNRPLHSNTVQKDSTLQNKLTNNIPLDRGHTGQYHSDTDKGNRGSGDGVSKCSSKEVQTGRNVAKESVKVSSRGRLISDEVIRNRSHENDVLPAINVRQAEYDVSDESELTRSESELSLKSDREEALDSKNSHHIKYYSDNEKLQLHGNSEKENLHQTYKAAPADHPHEEIKTKGKPTKTDSVPKLPQLKQEHRKPVWDSGKGYQSEKVKDHSSMTALPQIQNIKDLSERTFDIPLVNDPIRCEISIPTRHVTKKVQFSNKNTIVEHKTNENSHTHPSNRKNTQRSHKTRSVHLPPLQDKQGGSVAAAPSSKDTEEWKSVYVNIHDPEQRTKTLGDILYAVRLRMRENEQNLMYGQTPAADRTDNTLCDYLLSHKLDQDGIRKTKKKAHQFKKGGHYPSHTAERMHRRSTAVQLQNYLKKLSRQRRMIEHLEGEEYRLTHIVGHPHLRDAAHKSVQ